MPEYHQKKDFTPAGQKLITLNFPSFFHKKSNSSRDLARQRKHFIIAERMTVCSLHFRRGELRKCKSLNRRIFEDGALPSKFAINHECDKCE